MLILQIAAAIIVGFLLLSLLFGTEGGRAVLAFTLGAGSVAVVLGIVGIAGVFLLGERADGLLVPFLWVAAGLSVAAGWRAASLEH